MLASLGQLSSLYVLRDVPVSTRAGHSQQYVDVRSDKLAASWPTARRHPLWRYVVGGSPIEATRARLQGLRRRPASTPSRRVVSRGVARDRDASRLPEMYPQCTRVLHEQATRNAYLQAFCESPLTDSNRRPPPYHGGSGAVLACTPGHSRSCFSCKSGLRMCLAVPARARACST